MNGYPELLLDLVESGEAARLRKDAGIRQRTIADALGVSQVAVNYWEHGTHLPNLTRAHQWLRVLQGLARHEEAIEAGDDP